MCGATETDGQMVVRLHFEDPEDPEDPGIPGDPGGIPGSGLGVDPGVRSCAVRRGDPGGIPGSGLALCVESSPRRCATRKT